MEKDSKAEEEEHTVDVTSIIESCAASLTPREPFLCNNESFSLYDSMSALEIMHPKLDCCEIPASSMPLVGTSCCEDDKNKMVGPRPLPTGLDDAVCALPWDELSIRDVANIAVESLTRLDSFLGGASVAESTFTCLYAHKPVLADMKYRLEVAADESLTDKFESLLNGKSPDESSSLIAQHALYAVTVANVEISELVREIIVNADIYEEEDFNNSTFGLKFFSEENRDESIRIIPRTIKMLCNLCGTDDSDAHIIRLILQFQLEMLTACSSMGKLTPENVRPVAERTKGVIDSGLKQLKELQASLDTRKSASPMTDPVLRRSFDPFIYRPLVGNIPIRKVSFHTPLEAIVILQRILGEIEWAVCNLLLYEASLRPIQRMLERISSSSLNILSRSLLVLALYFGEKLLGQYDMHELILSDVKQSSGMPDSWKENVYVQAFVHRLVKPVYDTSRMLLLNRCRQNAYIETLVFQEWVSVQQDALQVDSAVLDSATEDMNGLPFAHFSIYVRSRLTWLMDHHVTLSIELTLFRGHHDLAVAYWYRDYLLSTLMVMASNMRQSRLASLDLISPENVSKSRGKKKSGKRGDKHKATSSSSTVLSAVDFDHCLLQAKRDLCKGITRFLAALYQAELIHPPVYEFTTHEIRFQQRFDAFEMISSPPPLKYGDFLQGFDFSSVSQEQLLDATAECFQTSKKALDELLKLDPTMLPLPEEELRNLTKVCVGNSVFVMKLSQLVNLGNTSGTSVSFDWETNTQFCTIRLS